MTEEELQPLVDSWRAANPKIVRFWWMWIGLKECVKMRIPTETRPPLRLPERHALFITLLLPAGGSPM